MICEAFVKLAELIEVRGFAIPLSVHPGAVEIVIDDTWQASINGHQEAAEWRGANLLPFHAAVEFNGWPAGVFGPHGGVICAGDAGNEDSLIAALDAAIDQERGDRLGRDGGDT